MVGFLRRWFPAPATCGDLCRNVADEVEAMRNAAALEALARERATR